MKITFLNLLAGCGLLISFMISAGYAAGDLPADVPESIVTVLDTEYPGWHLTPIDTSLVARKNRGAYSNFLRNDINDDKKLDYVLEINYIDNRSDVQTAAIAFIADGDSYTQYRLTDIWVGSDHKLTYQLSETALRFVAKGQPGYRAGDENASNTTRNPAPVYKVNVIEVITLNKAVTALAFDGNGFEQVRKANPGQDRK